MEYATEADIWPTDAPANAAGLTLHANLLVGRATITAQYRTDDAGFPADTGLRDTFKQAVTEQAKFWDSQGLDPGAGAAKVAAENAPTQKTIDGASLAYSVSLVEAGKQSRVQALTSLCPTAYYLLDDAGLLNQAPVRR